MDNPPGAARGAMLLLFDIAAGAVVEHDDWHTHEHIPERLSIPGFLRGSRWAAPTSPHYLVHYEVADLAVLDSPAYLERLNHPSPWTAKMMRHYLGMRRSLCNVVAGAGNGVGGNALLVHFEPGDGTDARLREWLVGSVLPGLAVRPGIASAHLFENALAARMTREQRIRGHDAALRAAVLVTGYDEDALLAVAGGDLAAARLVANGAAADGQGQHAFRLAHTCAASTPGAPW